MSLVGLDPVKLPGGAGDSEQAASPNIKAAVKAIPLLTVPAGTTGQPRRGDCQVTAAGGR